jgi:hypothetical protein
MHGKKILFLFLALLLPICVFLFLKIFGKNEFAVQPLFQDSIPIAFAKCPKVTLPYKVAPEVLKQYLTNDDSLGLIFFKKDNSSRESDNQMARISKQFEQDRIKITTTASSGSSPDGFKECTFFLKTPYDLVLVDSKGVIRGQYVSHDRDEMDRLITEADIILKKY